MITIEAAWMFSPTPPAWIWLTSAAWPLTRENWSTRSWRVAGDSDPVNGPKARSPRFEATVSRNSRKKE